MTLLDAPKYNSARANLIRNLVIGLLIAVVLGGISSWFLWDWPEEHKVSTFMSAVEAKDYEKAYGIWNHDEDWKQHQDRFKDYPYDRFLEDWTPAGKGNDNGPITSHKITMSKTAGNGVIVGVAINGRPKTIFLRVDHTTKQIGFSPVELYVGP